MSVIGEVVGVVACVAGVISAYRDGGAIIEKIKVKRAARRAPPPPRLLEESIDQAPEEIEREEKRGISRFGRAFEEGDHIAVIALQAITIQLQGSLLDKLKQAAFDDEVTDFTYLVDAADLGRDRTIGAMLELKQRLLQATPINELSMPTIQDPKTAQMTVQTKQLPTRTTPIRTATESLSPAQSPSPRPARTWTREYSGGGSHEVSGDSDTASGADDSAPQTTHRKRHSSLLGFLNRHHRSQSGSNDNMPKPVAEEIRHNSTSSASVPFQPPKQCDASNQQQQSGAQRQPSFTYQSWEDDPAKIWGAEEQQRRDTMASIAVSPDGGTPTGNAMVRTTSNTTPSLTHSAHSQSTSVPTPTPDNEYLGFCKGAWRLQNGDRKGAFTKCKEFNDGWSQSSVYFLACASGKCAFAGHIPPEKIWDKIWTVEGKGIKFRWPFLAKSHVPQTKVKDHQYAYQCIFCTYLGEKSPVFFGTDTYLSHVAEHRGQHMGEVVLYKCRAVADHVTEDHEEFDINLWPLNTKEAMQRRKDSTVLSDELLSFGPTGKAGGDPQDSMFSANEPWNEGLSEFHWGGDMERTELE